MYNYVVKVVYNSQILCSDWIGYHVSFHVNIVELSLLYMEFYMIFTPLCVGGRIVS